MGTLQNLLILFDLTSSVKIVRVFFLEKGIYNFICMKLSNIDTPNISNITRIILTAQT
jgi:hypothetical protein